MLQFTFTTHEWPTDIFQAAEVAAREKSIPLESGAWYVTTWSAFAGGPYTFLVEDEEAKTERENEPPNFL
jgi:hypothetical protein